MIHRDNAPDKEPKNRKKDSVYAVVSCIIFALFLFFATTLYMVSYRIAVSAKAASARITDGIMLHLSAVAQNWIPVFIVALILLSAFLSFVQAEKKESPESFAQKQRQVLLSAGMAITALLVLFIAISLITLIFY